MNPLYDYVFLNLEGRYDAAAVKAMADGLRSPNAVSRKALIVRIPPIDVDGAEAGTQTVLAEAKRAKLADMLTANPQDVAQRVKEGFLALLMQGPSADEAITIGRAASGR